MFDKDRVVQGEFFGACLDARLLGQFSNGTVCGWFIDFEISRW